MSTSPFRHHFDLFGLRVCHLHDLLIVNFYPFQRRVGCGVMVTNPTNTWALRENRVCDGGYEWWWGLVYFRIDWWNTVPVFNHPPQQERK